MHVSFVFKLFDRVLKVVAVVVDTRLSEYLVESVNVVWKGEMGDKGMQTTGGHLTTGVTKGNQSNVVEVTHAVMAENDLKLSN